MWFPTLELTRCGSAHIVFDADRLVWCRVTFQMLESISYQTGAGGTVRLFSLEPMLTRNTEKCNSIILVERKVSPDGCGEAIAGTHALGRAGQHFDLFDSIFQGRVRYGTYRGVQAIYTTGITGTEHFGKLGTTSIPVPEISVSSVRHQYAVPVQTFVPVPDTFASLVRRQYRYRTLP